MARLSSFPYQKVLFFFFNLLTIFFSYSYNLYKNFSFKLFWKLLGSIFLFPSSHDFNWFIRLFQNNSNSPFKKGKRLIKSFYLFVIEKLLRKMVINYDSYSFTYMIFLFHCKNSVELSSAERTKRSVFIICSASDLDAP